MSSYNPVVKNAAGGAILNVALEPRVPTGGFQTDPTLATGDVKISIDGGGFTNLGTLPVVTPAGGKNVKIVLSQAETNGDNLVILFSDAAGDEWNDLLLDIATVAANFDDIKTDTAAILVDTGTTLQAELDGIQADTEDIQARLPAALTAGGNIKADVLKIEGADPSDTIRDAVVDDATRIDASALNTVSGTTIPGLDTKADTAQADLDTLTGADGATLATTQGNYAPSKAGDAMTLTSAYDFAKGTEAMTEAYAANGAAPTPIEALYGIQQMLQMFAISGTSLTVKKLDNATTAFVVTLNDATSPTGAART